MKRILAIVILLTAVYSCNNNLKSPETGIDKLPPEFEKEFDSLKSVIPPEDKSTLELLYSFMPLEDKLDYPPVFHYKNMLATLKAKNELSWGKTIPGNIFTYFVLPLRINNENLDTGRIFFYKELKNRIKDMTMLDAAMEVNHYCHEHVTYRSSDGRTSSPMTTYRNGYGRCGEESVFVVSVLRSVSIPARQVYTPRWAHTDDNHAWVEFWADGKWYYYGATEPAPAPNTGWFTEPARRAMLVGTRINGPYKGDERINYSSKSYTVINTTPVYAPTKEVFVKVIREGKPVKQASVSFQIYNYGEFFTLGPKKTGENGLASFLTGYGDMLVWATDGALFNYSEFDVRTTDTLVLELTKNSGYEASVDFDYNPPARPEPLVVSPEGKEKNDKRLKYEDSLRRAYELTFPDSARIAEIATANNLDFEKLKPIINKSRGNYRQIIAFINSAPKNRKEDALTLLTIISEKDLHDVTATILADHLLNTPPYESVKSELSRSDLEKYLFNPRVEYEMLLAYRRFVQLFFEERNIGTPEEIYNWMRDSLSYDSTNYSHVPISAKGMFSARLTDGVSRDIVFVEACRSLGFPARLQEGSLVPEYFLNGKWETANFGAGNNQKQDKEFGFLHLNYEDEGLKYFKHFTIAKWNKGQFNTLEYDWDKPIAGFGDSIKLSTGYYRLTTGNRQPDGSVLSKLIFFHIKADEVTAVDVILRTQAREEKVLAHIDASSVLFTQNKKACTIVDAKPVVALWIDPNLEPSKHIIQDINAFRSEFEKKDIEIIIITKKPASNLDPDYFARIPATAVYRTDTNFGILKSLGKQLKTDLSTNLPVVTIIKPNGDVVFLKAGYSIGIGEELLKTL